MIHHPLILKDQHISAQQVAESLGVDNILPNQQVYNPINPRSLPVQSLKLITANPIRLC